MAGGPEAARPGPALRVLTFNLWGLNHWDERRSDVVAWLARVGADVVCLQEVTVGGPHDQLNWLAEQTATTAAFAGGRRAGGVEFGNAVLTRLPILDTDDLELTRCGLDIEPRYALRVSVDGPAGPVAVHTTHLSHLFRHGYVRESQVVQLSEWMADGTPTTFPPVLAGDLNASPESAEVRFLKGLQSLQGRSYHLFDAAEITGLVAPTWSNSNPWAAPELLPDQRIDYLLVGVRAPGGAGRVLGSGLVGDRIIEHVLPAITSASTRISPPRDQAPRPGTPVPVAAGSH